MKKIFVAAAMVLVLALPASAQRHGGGNPPAVPGTGGGNAGPEGMFGWAQDENPGKARQAIARFLQLTEEQMAQWEQLATTLRDTVAPLREQIAGLEGQLRELLSGANPDPAAVGALVIQIKGLREQVAAAHQAYVSGFEAMLSPEQLARYRVLVAFSQHPGLIPACHVVGLCR